MWNQNRTYLKCGCKWDICRDAGFQTVFEHISRLKDLFSLKATGLWQDTWPSGPSGSIWLHLLSACQKTACFCRVKQAGKAWLRCSALLEIERLRILWAARDLEASSSLINLWQEVSLSALCAMLLIYMLIWIQRIAGISRRGSVPKSIHSVTETI